MKGLQYKPIQREANPFIQNTFSYTTVCDYDGQKQGSYNNPISYVRSRYFFPFFLPLEWDINDKIKWYYSKFLKSYNNQCRCLRTTHRPTSKVFWSVILEPKFAQLEFLSKCRNNIIGPAIKMKMYNMFRPDSTLKITLDDWWLQACSAGLHSTKFIIWEF